MSEKRKFSVTASDGSTFTRTTHRTYTHVVLVDGALVHEREAGWGVWGWCGRYDLAVKQAAQAREVYRDVEIVEVT